MKFAQLEVFNDKENKMKPISQKLTDFEVYGKGKCNFSQMENDDERSYKKRQKHADAAEGDEPCFDYTDGRRVLFPIR